MPKKPEIYEARFVFTQPTDSMTSDDQSIEVSLEDAGGGHFIAIKTDRWSVDSPEELADLLRWCMGAMEDWKKEPH